MWLKRCTSVCWWSLSGTDQAALYVTISVILRVLLWCLAHPFSKSSTLSWLHWFTFLYLTLALSLSLSFRGSLPQPFPSVRLCIRWWLQGHPATLMHWQLIDRFASKWLPGFNAACFCSSLALCQRFCTSINRVDRSTLPPSLRLLG